MRIKQWKGFLWGLALSCCLGSFVLLVGHNDHTTVPDFPHYTFDSREAISTIRLEQCLPETKIAFLKVHKAGSSTVANILQRFGYTRNLNFVVPKKKLHEFGYNYIGKRGETVSQDKILPVPPGQTYDILWNHVTYDRDAFREVMPSGTRYVTILREPFDQFVSAFEYYFLAGKRRNATRFLNRNPLAEYLDNKKLLKDNHLMNHVRNSQAYDMGFQPFELMNRTLTLEYIKQLAGDFDIVMLMEYFDESLILLKRMLCWSLKDILYFPHNKNRLKIQRLFRQEHYEKHRKISSADYDLYEHFRKIFWEKVWHEGPDFFEEVLYFKKLLVQLRDYCLVQKSLVVPESKWSDGFVVNRVDCVYIQMSELGFYDRIMNRTYSKLLPYIHY